jgi:hypothetical protein
MIPAELSASGPRLSVRFLSLERGEICSLAWASRRFTLLFALGNAPSKEAFENPATAKW